MEIAHLKEFIKLGEHLSFSRAAKDLFMAQSTLSDHVASLEKELGVQLVTRAGTKIDLTDAGWVMFDRAQRIESIYAAMVVECKKADCLGANVRVVELASALGLARLFDDAAQSLGADGIGPCDLSFVSADHHTLEELLRMGAADVCIAASCPGQAPQLEDDQGDLVCVPIVRSPLYLYVSQDSPIAPLDRVRVSDLHGKHILSSNLPIFRFDRMAIAALLSRNGIDPQYRLFRSESLIDSIPLDREAVLYLNAYYASLYEKSWVADGQTLVRKEIDGVDLEIEYHGVFLNTAKPVVKSLMEIVACRENGEGRRSRAVPPLLGTP